MAKCRHLSMGGIVPKRDHRGQELKQMSSWDILST